MLSKLDYLRNLHELAKAQRGNTGINTSELEREFLSFSTHSKKPSLKVKLPNLYQPQNEEIGHLEKIVSFFDLNRTYEKGIDISGGYDIYELRHLIFLSLRQSSADYSTTLRSYLTPLLEKVYEDSGLLIEEFSVNEAIGSKIEVRRGTVDLDEIGVFPERFLPGPYQLSVELDTPNNSVAKFKELSDELIEIKNNPVKFLSNPNVLKSAKKAIELREILGSLSRYTYPENSKISLNVNSYVSRTLDHTYFYLYNPQNNKNVLVYFGYEPFEIGKKPKHLEVFFGREYQHTLVRLVEMGFYVPSQSVLESRIQRLGEIYDDDKRHGNNMQSKHSTLLKTKSKLEDVSDYFKKVVNEKMRLEMVVKQIPELLEFIVYPSMKDPILHELLPRLSWNEGIREYLNTRRFMRLYNAAEKDERARMVSSIQPSILFNNQQNNDLNVWLYRNHREFCESNGINFELIK